MSAPTQTQTPPPPPVGYTGMDDVLIPTPQVASSIRSETYPFSVISVDTTKDPENDQEIGTSVYVTSESFDIPTSTLMLAERWITGHSDPKVKFRLVSRTAVESQAVPAVLDEKGKVFSPPYTVVFESIGAQNYPGSMRPHDNKHNRQMFYFLPVSANRIFTARVVREIKYFEGYPQFEAQYEHFLATLKRDTATPQSTLQGSKPRTRRFYTAYFSFEIFLREKDGGNQWLINKTSSQRTDVWHTKEGDIVVVFKIISGYDFDVARENQTLMMDQKGLVKNMVSVVRGMGSDEPIPDLKYLQPKWAGQELFGHREENNTRISIDLSGAYKTGKQFDVGFEGPPAAMKAHEKDILAWLAQFKILQ